MKGVLGRLDKIFSDNWWLLFIILIMAVGLFLCHHSFDYRYSETNIYHALTHPFVNLLGILLMIGPGFLTALFYCLIGKTDGYRGDPFGGFVAAFWLGCIMAFLYSSGQGCLSGGIIVLIGVGGTVILGFLAITIPSQKTKKSLS